MRAILSAQKKIPCQRLFLLLILAGLIYAYYYHSITRPYRPYIPMFRVRSHHRSVSDKVSIAHYTTTYGHRTDSKTFSFDANLKQICEVIDPEEYLYANGVVVSIVDFVRFPTVEDKKQLYRTKHPSQLWVFHSEESPRNSYRTVQIKNITELDDWFNLTATLKPESDIQIQYRGYRIKPELSHFFQNKINRTLNSTFIPPSKTFPNLNITYLNTLTSALNQEYFSRQDHYSKTCPYTCNQPLPDDVFRSIEPTLKPISVPKLSHDTVYIAWFVSNCDSHSGREEYVLKLRSQPGIHVDIYGGCSSVLNSHIVPLQCKKGTPNCTEITLSNYRFYLSFENSKCDTYISEKYWMQGLNGNAVPIVMGAKREQYKRIAVPNSYLHVDDFASVEQLARELHRLNRNLTEFTKYLQWKQLYDVDGQYVSVIGLGIHTTLCLLGHYQRLHHLKENNKHVQFLLQRIRDIFSVGTGKLPNFNWETAKLKPVKISEFYNPGVNCWDNEYPSFSRRAFNFLFTWWKLF